MVESFDEVALDHARDVAVALPTGRPQGHVITAPLSARAHFEQPGARADLGGAVVAYIDPTHPGHDFLGDGENAQRGLRGLAGRVRAALSL
jgi:hypothetical protein